MSDNITLPREVVEAVLRIVERNRDWSEVRQSGDYAAILRTALAAPSEDIEALRRDAESWRRLMSGVGSLDADMEDKT